MWLATTRGFFSVVCAHDKDGNPHPDLMMIRARNHAHLAALKEKYELPRIRKSEGTDYPYRIICPRDTALVVIAELAADIDYSNFKNACKDARPQDTAYAQFLNTVWSTGLRMHQGHPRGLPWFL